MDQTMTPRSDSSSGFQSGLWNDGDRPKVGRSANEAHCDIVFEQYKMVVEMADHLSSRRSLANTFFLGLNTTALAAFGIFSQKQPLTSTWWLLPALVALLVQCAAWHWLVRSYRQLSAAKFAVIAQMEERLPAAPFRLEWELLEEGANWKSYLSLTHLEQVVPAALACTYIASFAAAVAY
ncbi:RipA family octameric membrane protein [Micromonospora sp. RB23]